VTVPPTVVSAEGEVTTGPGIPAYLAELLVASQDLTMSAKLILLQATEELKTAVAARNFNFAVCVHIPFAPKEIQDLLYEDLGLQARDQNKKV
jgi:precorrin-2 methylase